MMSLRIKGILMSLGFGLVFLVLMFAWSAGIGKFDFSGNIGGGFVLGVLGTWLMYALFLWMGPGTLRDGKVFDPKHTITSLAIGFAVIAFFSFGAILLNRMGDPGSIRSVRDLEPFTFILFALFIAGGAYGKLSERAQKKLEARQNLEQS
ncbi:MAG: hypothetical protein Q7S28_02220 [bacterium]|nr:hypothetical protein [bacterium]